MNQLLTKISCIYEYIAIIFGQFRNYAGNEISTLIAGDVRHIFHGVRPVATVDTCVLYFNGSHL